MPGANGRRAGMGNPEPCPIKCQLLDAPGSNHASYHRDVVGVFDLIEENRQSVIVLDDVSAIFEQPKALQILLAALGTPHDGSRTRTGPYFEPGGIRYSHGVPAAGCSSRPCVGRGFHRRSSCFPNFVNLGSGPEATVADRDRRRDTAAHQALAFRTPRFEPLISCG
jgi:hypothetical protein